MKTTRLVTRLTIFFLLALTLPLLTSAVVFGLGFAQYSEQAVRTHQASIVAVGQAYIQNYFDNLFDQLFIMASFANSTDFAVAQQAVMKVCQRAPQTYLTISISDFDGNERMRLQECIPLPESSLRNVRSQEPFFRAQRGETFIRSVSFDVENNPISTISFPAKSFDGQQIVFIAEVNLGTIWNPLNELNVGDDGYLFVVDQRGNLIGYRDQQLIAQQENLAAAPSVAPLLVGRAAVEAVQYVGLLGEQVIGSSALVQPINWGLVLEQPTASIFATRNAMATQFTVSILLFALGAVIISFFISRSIVRPIEQLVSATQVIAGGNLSAQAQVQTQDEIGELASNFNIMTHQLRELLSGLEQRVAERTKALAASAEISRRLSSLTNERDLTVQVVEQLKAAFDYYHAHIYLLDEAGETLRMAGGTGEAGKTLLERGHSLPLGKGLVGRAAQTRQVVLVPETHADPNWLPNPLLPETQAEVAVPILAGDTVLGVLDVQNNAPYSLTAQDAELIRSIADQVAIALQNIRANARAREAAESLQRLVETSPVGIAVLDAETGVFLEANDNALALFDVERSQMGKVGPIQLSPPTQPDGRDSAEKVAEEIGIAMQTGAHVFEWLHRTAQGREFLAEIRLVRAVDVHGRTVLNAILTDITERRRQEEQAHRRAQQQEALNRIAQSIQRAARVEEALQIAARELGHALGRKPTLVKLEPLADVSHQAEPSETGKG